MTATDELLPCPFCGGEARVEHCITCGYDSYWVECANRIDCGCKVEPVTDVKDIAIMTWNRRANRERGECRLIRRGNLSDWPEMVCWSCSECGFGWHHSVNDSQFSYCPNCGARVVAANERVRG